MSQLPAAAFRPDDDQRQAQLGWLFQFAFVCLLLGEVLLSQRPTAIDFPVIFQIVVLAVFLSFGILRIFARADRALGDHLTVVVLIYLLYFYAVGFVLSRLNGVAFLGAIEYPYRISCLFIVLVTPFFIRRESDLNRLFALTLTMMGVQIVRDLFVGAGDGEVHILTQRLWSQEFASVLFLGTLPFSFGGLILYWNAPKRRFLNRTLLMALWAVLVLKLFLTYSRTVWLIVFPLNLAGVYVLLYRKTDISPEVRRMGKRMSRLILLLAMAGIVVVVLLTSFEPKVMDFIQKRQELTGQESQNRLSEYQTAFEEWLASPAWGQGFGYRAKVFKTSKERLQEYVHNFVLQFMMSSGLIGLSLILVLLGGTFVRLWRLFKRARSQLQSAVLVSSLLTLFNVLLMGSVQTVMLKHEVYLLLAVIISFSIAIKRFQRKTFCRECHRFLPSFETPGTLVTTMRAPLSKLPAEMT